MLTDFIPVYLTMYVVLIRTNIQYVHMYQLTKEHSLSDMLIKDQKSKLRIKHEGLLPKGIMIMYDNALWPTQSTVYKKINSKTRERIIFYL